jgi:hypothetical protein
MPATLQKFSNAPQDRSYEGVIECHHRQKYLVAWDDKEWNSVKDCVRVAETAVRRSHGKARGD